MSLGSRSSNPPCPCSQNLGASVTRRGARPRTVSRRHRDRKRFALVDNYYHSLPAGGDIIISRREPPHHGRVEFTSPRPTATSCLYRILGSAHLSCHHVTPIKRAGDMRSSTARDYFFASTKYSDQRESSTQCYYIYVADVCYEKYERRRTYVKSKHRRLNSTSIADHARAARVLQLSQIVSSLFSV